MNSVPENLMTRPCDEYDKKLNKYGVKVGVDMKNECGLHYWENKSDPDDPES